MVNVPSVCKEAHSLSGVGSLFFLSGEMCESGFEIFKLTCEYGQAELLGQRPTVPGPRSFPGVSPGRVELLSPAPSWGPGLWGSPAFSPSAVEEPQEGTKRRKDKHLPDGD